MLAIPTRYLQHFTQVSLDVVLSLSVTVLSLSHIQQHESSHFHKTTHVQSLYLLANFHNKLSYSDDHHGILQTKHRSWTLEHVFSCLKNTFFVDEILYRFYSIFHTFLYSFLQTPGQVH